MRLFDKSQRYKRVYIKSLWEKKTKNSLQLKRVDLRLLGKRSMNSTTMCFVLICPDKTFSCAGDSLVSVNVIYREGTPKEIPGKFGKYVYSHEILDQIVLKKYI